MTAGCNFSNERPDGMNEFDGRTHCCLQPRTSLQVLGRENQVSHGAHAPRNHHGVGWNSTAVATLTFSFL